MDMDALSDITTLAVAGTALVLLVLFAHYRRTRAQREAYRDNADTVVGWPPEVARVLTIDERQAYELLRRAMPNHLVLAQVPLARFIRVPLKRSYTEWVQRVGTLSADLLLCDAGSRVIAVIDIRAASESERTRRRHERMARVLRQAGVHVLTWREGALPSASEVRTVFAPLINPEGAAPKALTSRPMDLIPVAEMEELLAEGDRRLGAQDAVPEPVHSGYYEGELELTPIR
jgi:hypothetical protein